MDKAKEILNTFKVPIILICALLVVFIGLKYGLPLFMEANKSDAPVVEIEAECDKEYKSIENIKLDDFKITVTHEDGKKNKISADEVTLDKSSVKPVGKIVTVKVIYNEDKSISCEAEVNIKREKVLGFQCGYPNVTDVIAVLYSNGELCFEGKGDTLVFYEGKYPWLDYEESEECPIVSVSFQDTVTPSNMNYWFEGLETLSYCDPIPKSVRSMVRTFKGCKGLTESADWSEAESLLNINEAYADCTSLMSVSAVPKRVRIAKETFKGCTELQATPDLSKAENLVNLTGMFSKCDKLINAQVSPNATDITSMFEECINLKKMPEIPESVIIMKNSFAKDTNLTTLSNIPAYVENTESTFSGCELITGEMIVNANPMKFGSMFSDAASATKVNLTGDSLMLDVLANTSNTSNIYVNMSKPNPNLKKYEDVFVKTN